VVTGPFDRAQYDRDLPAGQFRANGQLFGGQVVLEEVRVTRQRHKQVTGKVHVDKLDLGKLANLIPSVAFSGTPPTGALSADLEIKQLPIDDPKRADVTLVIRALEVERGGHRVQLTEPSGVIALRNNDLSIPDVRLEARTASGLTAVLIAGGGVKAVTTAPDLDLAVRVEPLDLSRLSKDIPEVARASGTVDAQLRMSGSPQAPRYSGAAHVKDGELALKGTPLSLDAIQVDVDIGGGEVRVTRATANVGSGTLSATARMPVRGLEIGTAQATVVLRNLKLPVADGVDMTADADLSATYRPGGGDGVERSLPDVKGTVALTSFSYTRPIAMSVNFGQLAGKAQRTTVESYDPKGDFVRFHVTVASPKPLRFRNNLVDMQLSVAEPGIVLSGTNQRFGARGLLKVLPESKLTLRNNEFDVREGWVRFDDAARIAPKVDVRAQTEYRRYASTASAGGEGGVSGAAGAAGASTSGNWRINLHAHGDAQDLKVNLSSDPPLSQEDIVLLLTMGMTRAEIDSGLASSLGETVGLEALTSVTGADKAVKKVVPIIDEFRFGTGYSSRTGRTEPNVTVGKKLTKDVRANVTTGVTENREVRSTVEWRMSKRVSVQGSYDNANDAGSSTLGNVGADLRWRLEFE
jgi:translocation and assembly module TamB